MNLSDFKDSPDLSSRLLYLKGLKALIPMVEDMIKLIDTFEDEKTYTKIKANLLDKISAYDVYQQKNPYEQNTTTDIERTVQGENGLLDNDGRLREDQNVEAVQRTLGDGDNSIDLEAIPFP